MYFKHFLKWQHLFFPYPLWYVCHQCTIQLHSFAEPLWMCIPCGTGLVTGHLASHLTQSRFSCDLCWHIFSWKIQHTQFSCLYSSIISIKIFIFFIWWNTWYDFDFILFFHKPNKGNFNFLEVKSPSLLIFKNFKVSYCLDKENSSSIKGFWLVP